MTGIIDNYGVAGLANSNGCDDIPDQLQIDLGDRNPCGRQAPGNRDPHIGL